MTKHNQSTKESKNKSVEELTSEITTLRQENSNLRCQLSVLQDHHAQALLELNQHKESENKYKQLNDMLVDNLKMSTDSVHLYVYILQISKKNNITLTLEGEFLTNRVKELQEELEKYRSGVHDSVDRRVKNIVGEFTQEQELEMQRAKSRISFRSGNDKVSHNNISHNHTYYNIEYKSKNSDGSNSQSKQQHDQDSSSSHTKTSKTTKTTTAFKKKNNLFTTGSANDQQQHQDDNFSQVSNSISSEQNFQRETVSQSQSSLTRIINANTATIAGTNDDSFSSDNPVNINIQNICRKCHEMLKQVQQKDRMIDELSQKLFNLNIYVQDLTDKKVSQTEQLQDMLQNKEHSWREKYNDLSDVYEQLKDQYHHLLEQLNSAPMITNGNGSQSQVSNNCEYYELDDHIYDDANGNSPNFRDKQNSDRINQQNGNNGRRPSQFNQAANDRENRMLNEISNLVNCIGKNKRQAQMKEHHGGYSRVSYGSKRPTTSSRLSQQPQNRLESSTFTIKQGVNRHLGNNSSLLY